MIFLPGSHHDPVLYMTPTSEIAEARARFIEAMRERTDRSDAPAFEGILDDFLEWAESKAGELYLSSDEGTQAIVRFRRTRDDRVFLGAYPHQNGATTLGVLVHSERRMPEKLLAEVRARIRAITNSPDADDGTLKLRFRTLREPSTRKRVKELLDWLMVTAFPT